MQLSLSTLFATAKATFSSSPVPSLHHRSARQILPPNLLCGRSKSSCCNGFGYARPALARSHHRVAQTVRIASCYLFWCWCCWHGPWTTWSHLRSLSPSLFSLWRFSSAKLLDLLRWVFFNGELGDWRFGFYDDLGDRIYSSFSRCLIFSHIFGRLMCFLFQFLLPLLYFSF